MELGERKNEILRLVVSGYIDTGEPVGSKAVAEKLGGVSSATIRNDMAELEKLGLLEQPHTSSGRVPTVDAYRVFVEKLMPRASLPETVRTEVVAELRGGSASTEALIARAGQLLARLTECAAVAITPYISEMRLLKLNLYAADNCVYIVVAVTNEGMASPKTCRTRNTVSDKELRLLSKAINDRFADRKINAVLAEDIKRLTDELELSGDGCILCSTAVSAVSECENSFVYIGGVSRLLHRTDMLTAHRVVELLDRRDALSELLRSIHGDHARVMIGEDCRDERLCEAAVVGCGYNGPLGEGSVALIGPVRINYRDAVASVDFIAKTVSEILEDEYR